ncbi:prolylcarboxypeptidase isoform 2 preproprotein [Acanthamoeba castellanii str. Neff]|uniref:Prolylcarboxypeptidase isoform 2 preproprotein n=1 Tax=Acanthamoeba castellanii (strain ATCC 30010 / Neff) TaxID=1257118 RepID=L8GFD5_ACACF|nr:prolylcarboxypeptidase isoform 2 preproprotein [Acanthamoeba castellanii str. Neff]ELR11692.1 prolylcarboxypeptidase isoform 2 preproprotein [Acanthamoeba castellanii str. Neff]
MHRVEERKAYVWGVVVVVVWLAAVSCPADGAILPGVRTLSPHGEATTHQSAPGLPPPPTYRTLYFDQTLDHFNFATQPATYKQRFLLADEYWRGSYPGGCPGPIFFYTGNEAPVTDYYSASGFFTQVLAPKHNALLVFAESMPFGSKSFDPEKISYLSPEQALADYAVLITHLKETLPHARNCPVFAFGGSYGGILTAWFRMKYPDIVMGGLAASAPLSFYGTGISPYAFTNSASDTFAQARLGCAPLIAQAFETLQRFSATPEGCERFAKAFKLCGPLNSQAEASAVVYWVEMGLASMAMLDYPFASNYGVSLPAWPVNKTCDRILEKAANNNDPDILAEALGYAIGVFYNNTGDHSCYDIKRDVPEWEKCCGWDYLHCTEVYIPIGFSGFFPHATYNLTADIEQCRQKFGITLRPNWARIQYGGFNITSSSNIIFSNGLLDPWHSSGVLHSLSDSLISIMIPEAGHHLDLWAPSPEDPIYIQRAREQEAVLIDKWLKEYWAKLL